MGVLPLTCMLEAKFICMRIMSALKASCCFFNSAAICCWKKFCICCMSVGIAVVVNVEVAAVAPVGSRKPRAREPVNVVGGGGLGAETLVD